MATPGQIQLISFTVGDLRCAARIDRVEEVVPASAPTRIPNAPAFVEGVLDLRGRVVPFVSLRKRFHVSGDPPPSSRIVVVRLERGVVGFLVDRAGMMRTAPEQVMAAPSHVPGLDAKFLAGVVRQEDALVLLLDFERVLSPDEARSLPSSP